MNDLKFDLLNLTSESRMSKEEYEFELERKIKFVEDYGINQTAFGFKLQEQQVKNLVSKYIKIVESRIKILEDSIATYYEDQKRKMKNMEQELMSTENERAKTWNEDKEKGGESVDVPKSSTSITVEKESVNVHEHQQRETKNITENEGVKTSSEDKEKGVNVQESSTGMGVDQESVKVHAQQVNQPGTSSAAAVYHHRPGKELLTRTKKLRDVIGKDDYDLEEIMKQVQLWGIVDSCPFVNLDIEGVISKVRKYVNLKKSRIEALKKMFSNMKENVVVIGTGSGSGTVDAKQEIEGTVSVNVVQSEEVVIGTVTDTKREIEGVDVVKERNLSEEAVVTDNVTPMNTKLETAVVDVVKQRNQSEEAVVTGNVGPMDAKLEIEGTAGVDVVKERNQSEEAVVTGSGLMDTKLETVGVDVVKDRNDQAAVSMTTKKEELGYGRGHVMHQQMLRQQQQSIGAKHEDSSTNDDKPADPVPPVVDPVPPTTEPVPPVAEPIYGPLAPYVNIAKRVPGRRRR